MNFDETMLKRLTSLEREVERLKVKESPGVWLDWTPTLTVAGGTAPTYTSEFINRYCRIGNHCTVCGKWYNASGGVAGAGANTIFTTLPFTAYTTYVLTGTAGLINGGTWISNLGILIYDTYFSILKADSSEITGAEQNNVVRELAFIFTYEAA